MGRGICAGPHQRVNEASKAFDEALAASPNDPLVLREAGAFHYRKGDMSRADGLLRQAMRLDPRDYMASFFYARMLDETGRQAQAAQYYKDVLRYVPEDAEVHEAYARSLGKTGDTAGAYIHMAYSACIPTTKNRPSATLTRPRPCRANLQIRVIFRSLRPPTKSARKYGKRTDDGYACHNHTGSKKGWPRGHSWRWSGDPGPEYDHEARRAEGAASV